MSMDAYGDLNDPKKCDRILKSIDKFRRNLPIPVNSGGHEIKRAVQTSKEIYPPNLIGTGTSGDRSVAIEVRYY